MKVLSARKTLPRTAKILPVVLGLALVAVGLRGKPVLALAGGAVLGVAGLVGGLAAARGDALPRFGRIPISSYGGREVPLRFMVRRGGQVLLFHRDFDPVTGEAPFRYSVHHLPPGVDPETIEGAGFEPPAGSRPRGFVPTADLEFVRLAAATYVDAASLAAAIRRSGAV